ncbi:MAG: VPLPA-CTERM-specific exosortase XrtD [Gammaproteobacteria bacterium]|nr:VPLPA-CTERM-specific exosortase XrtD [Gammaproteobacteria bacterium]
MITRLHPWFMVSLLVLATLFVFSQGVTQLVHKWNTMDEYSHGRLIPALTVYFIWRERALLASIERTGTYWGVMLCAVALALLVIGELSTLFVIVQYGMVLALWGSFVAVYGVRAAWRFIVPLVFLVFMVPLPTFLYNSLSAYLQLISSQLGVDFIRLCNIPVYLEGNIIDLGSYQLQVVEACNGLRYLFPLMSFGFICAWLFKAPMWQRTLVFVSTVPITILMNSFRIGVIGVMVQYWGTEMAEGFLHDFEGWIIFMACVGILFLEMWLLTVITRRGVTFRDVFWPDEPAPPTSLPSSRAVSGAVVSLALFAAVGMGVRTIGERQEAVPEREHFTSFPLVLSDWKGRPDRLEQKYIDALKFTDYYLANYRRGDDVANFYVAYYESQRKGQSAHSPRSCIPGGGWKITNLRQVELNGVHFAEKPARVNRVQIQKGEHRQLVYYWFQQRGRVITSEYAVKTSLVWDAITKKRTDGALVRLTVSLRPGQAWEDGDASLASFAEALSGKLQRYVPS